MLFRALIVSLGYLCCLNMNYSAKAARDKVNQTAHVRKTRGSLGTKNMAANRERAVD